MEPMLTRLPSLSSRTLTLILIAAVFFCGACELIRKQERSLVDQSVIRINQLGYTPEGIKVAVLAFKDEGKVTDFQVFSVDRHQVVFVAPVGKDYGKYGPFEQTFRLNFSNITDTGFFYIQVGKIRSPQFRIAENVYAGTADFVLRYMRQQRSGYNPYLKDSCHTQDGYTMYGPMPDSTLIDVSGGWHDASDYLQYATTSANATYHLLAAYRDFPEVFKDQYQGNGTSGKNGIADVLDEGRWGLQWLEKMHPKPDWLFNQLADDRDHQGMRLPTLDETDYGLGAGGPRPVYFATGEPQGLGKYQNRSTGLASTAGKFASAFALASQVYGAIDPKEAQQFREKALSAYALGLSKPGVCQTAPNKAPYFYEEDNWVDDMELASASLWRLTADASFAHRAMEYGREEQLTPWLGQDTARHYQWYPFHNFGHYELAKDARYKKEFSGFYKAGIEKVGEKARQNAFYRGIPFIWCSNNLTVSFAIQCMLYRKLTGDESFHALEQANIDWLFGCNPWGTSMVYGLPAKGDTPSDPHSAFTHIGKYPIDGGLVDGPVYTRIYDGLIGIHLTEPDEYAAFQSDLAVYHDDYGDYSTNEPTMDGTASLIYLLAGKEQESTEAAPRAKK